MTNEEAKELLDNLIGMVSDNQESDYDTALKIGIKALDQEPKTGHWIKYGHPRCGEQHYKCTSCGYYINFGQWGEFYSKEFKYCPNCGCRMKGGAE